MIKSDVYDQEKPYNPMNYTNNADLELSNSSQNITSNNNNISYSEETESPPPNK